MTMEKENKIAIMETFYSLQGEGLHSGRAAYFIRTAGCPVRCEWCDVKESWNVGDFPRLSPSEIVEKIPAYVNMSVITGGEPLIWNLSELNLLLRKRGIRVHLETSGCMEIKREDWDWVCISPKKSRLPLDETLLAADELKVVISTADDFIWAEENAVKVSETCALLLQPEWEKRADILPLICEYVKRNPKWRLSLQTHKYINVP